MCPCLHECIACFSNYKFGTLVIIFVHACMHACIFVCTTVRVRGRCEGFPSVWNEVLYSQWDATKRDREKRVVEGVDLKRCKGVGQPQRKSF